VIEQAEVVFKKHACRCHLDGWERTRRIRAVHAFLQCSEAFPSPSQAATRFLVSGQDSSARNSQNLLTKRRIWPEQSKLRSKMVKHDRHMSGDASVSETHSSNTISAALAFFCMPRASAAAPKDSNTIFINNGTQVFFACCCHIRKKQELSKPKELGVGFGNG
jgi:hypothetical protein